MFVKKLKILSLTIIFSVLLCSWVSAAKAADDTGANIFQSYNYDQSAPLSVQIKKYKHYTDCFMLRIVYSSTNGQRVPAILFEPFRASMWHPLPAIILLHDLGSSKEKLAKLGHFFAATGYSCLIIDEYGHGERAGRSLNGQSNAGTMSVYGMRQTIIDVRRAIDYMNTRAHISPKRIGIIGFSLGAVIAADVAGLDNRVKATVMVSGGSNGSAILWALVKRQHIIKQAGLMDAGAGIAAADKELDKEDLSKSVDPMTFAGHIAPRAILMMNGHDDGLISQDNIDELYHALEDSDHSKTQIIWFDTGHIIPLDRLYPPLRRWLFANL